MKTKITVTYVRFGSGSVPWAEGIYNTSCAEFAMAKATGPGGMELKTCARALDPQALAFVSDGEVFSQQPLPNYILVVHRRADGEHSHEIAIRQHAVNTAVGRLIKLLGHPQPQILFPTWTAWTNRKEQLVNGMLHAIPDHQLGFLLQHYAEEFNVEIKYNNTLDVGFVIEP